MQDQKITDFPFYLRMLAHNNGEIYDTLKHWNNYRKTISTLALDLLEYNPSYFQSNTGLFFNMVSQDYYFRRLYKLRFGIDFFESSVESECYFRNINMNHLLRKAFWEIETNKSLIHSEHFCILDAGLGLEDDA
ncbi:hypothetical protein [Pasteurella testudinis]|uniref:hypothetical protein n=1 Tax=Pasteurella testudinis TaxID=761 RepID=UPI00405A1863